MPLIREKAGVMLMNSAQREPVTSVKVPFVLMGFDQDAGVRLYAFEGIANGIRTKFTVGVDLALIHGFGIQIQELPLLCRGVLERQAEGQETCTLTLTAVDMRTYADNCAAARQATTLRRKSARKPTPYGL
jgi:hypothetical protein